MRIWLIFLIVLLVPSLYLGLMDYVKYQNNPSKGFHLSTVGEVWIDHDRVGFMSFKTSYQNQPAEWEQNVRPYLEWQALPLTLLPAILYSVWLLFCWLLGRGPFADWSNFTTANRTSSFSRASASERGSRMSYRRK